jgi:hypothetical protein
MLFDQRSHIAKRGNLHHFRNDDQARRGPRPIRAGNGVGSYAHATELPSNVVIRPQEIELSLRLLHRAWPPEKSPEGLSNQPSLFDYIDAPGT